MTHNTAQLWRDGERGRAETINGVEATIRAGYERRLLVRCCVCGDFRDSSGWHNGSALRQHRISHGLCPVCKSDYYGITTGGTHAQ